MSHAERLAEVSELSAPYLTSYALFNQAVADHLRLHPTDVQCLTRLTRRQGPFTIREIAAVTGLGSGPAGRLVDRLERSGYLVRERDESDRRRVLVHVEPSAASRLAALWCDLAENFHRLLESFDEAELAVVARYMRRTTELLDVQLEILHGRVPV